MSELLVNTIKKADGTGSITVPADTGTVVIKDGSNDVTLNDITAGGIYLGGTGAANYLDDYEEGTWTPSVGGTATYTDQAGKYTKIGNLVHVTGKITINSIGSGSVYNIQNFPFTAGGTPGFTYAGSVAYFSSAATNTIAFYLRMNPGDAAIAIADRSTAGSVPPNSNFFGNGTRMDFSMTYFV
mgnify:CR=1 FL=1